MWPKKLSSCVLNKTWGNVLNQDYVFTSSDAFDSGVRLSSYKIKDAQLLKLPGVISHSNHEAFAFQIHKFIRGRRQQCVVNSFIYRNPVPRNNRVLPRVLRALAPPKVIDPFRMTEPPEDVPGEGKSSPCTKQSPKTIKFP